MYQIRNYATDDREQVAHLLRRLWSYDVEQNSAYLAWRYEHNPYLKNSLAVAERDGRIVAVRGGYGMNWHIGGTTELIPCLGDTVVDRAHEGHALVQKLSRRLFAELAGAGARYVVNQSPGKLVEKISLRTGWRRVGDRKLTRYLDSDTKSGDFQALDDKAPGTEASSGLRIVVRPDPPDDLLELLDKRKHNAPVGHEIDREYIRWRFNNPFSTYRWICAYNETLTGFMLIARNAVARMKNRFRMLDLWATDSTIQAALLRRALDTGEFPNLYLWWNRVPRHVAQVLIDYEFTATPDELRNPTVLIRSITPDTDFTHNGINLLDMRNWDARMVHSDVA